MRGAGLAALVDAETVNRALEEAGLRREASALSMDRAWPHADGGLMALYTPEDGDLTRSWYLVSGASGGLAEAHRASLRRGCLHVLSQLDCLVGRFPCDPKLRRLPEVLAGRSPDLAALGLANPDLRVLRYKPTRRCVVSAGDDSWYLKMVRRREVDRIEAIHQALANAATPASVALPVARLGRPAALVWRGASGRSLTRLLGTPSGVEAAAAAGRALAGLHSSGSLLPRHHDVRQELDMVEAWIRLVSAVYPESGSPLVEAFEALAAEATCSRTLCPSHRDFHDQQVLVEDSQALLIDLDTAAMAEPELDVANMLVHLELYELANTGVQTSASRRAFVQAYLGSRWRLSERALSWYRSGALLRLACVYSFRPSDRSLAGRLASMALESLGAEVCDWGRKEIVL